MPLLRCNLAALLALILAGCAPMYAYAPVDVRFTPRPNAFRDTTLTVSVSDERDSKDFSFELREALTRAIRETFPSATILGKTASDKSNSNLTIRVKVQAYGASFSRRTWYGTTSFAVEIIDHRIAPPAQEDKEITVSESSFNWWGNITSNNVASDSYEQAVKELLNYLETKGT